MKRVLVTGTGGFVGSEIVRAIRASGVETVAHHRASGGDADPLTITTDLREPGALEKVPEVDTIFHCAAQLPTSHDDEDAAKNNRSLDDTALAFARARQCDMLYASTATLYGPGRPSTIRSAVDTTAGAYPLQKAVTEDRGMGQAVTMGTRFSSLRINAPYGPSQRTRTVLQNFISNALQNKDLLYYGSGSREQDFTYGLDIANAFIAAAHAESGYYIISGGSPISMKSLAHLVCDCAGLPSDRVKASGNLDPQEGLKIQLDISTSMKRLNWQPRTNLRQGIYNCIAARRVL